ncbi:hypothetical protein AAMO2058_001654600 [Amorphochlora amoebiformis]
MRRVWAFCGASLPIIGGYSGFRSFAIGNTKGKHSHVERPKGQDIASDLRKQRDKSKSCTVCSSQGRKIGDECKCELIFGYMHSGCPLNRKELGRSTWALLHTMAAYYPDNPTKQQKQDMEQFMRLAAKLYPCGYCADTTSQEISFNPPRVESREDLSLWLCEIHNEVNDRLGKPLFDCRQHRERWRDGPPDGMCS